MSTVLITGASSGIGFAFARICAEEGHDLILVARSQEMLEERAATLREERKISVTVVAADLTRDGAVSAVADAVRREKKTVDILINNAGFGQSGLFQDMDPEKIFGMIRLNMAALTELTRRFLPDMVQRRSGKILNVASTAAFQPGPRMAVYYATKAYVLSLSEALAYELKGTGVSVTVLCPGLTRSSFHERAGTRVAGLLRFNFMEAESVARAGWHGLLKNKCLVIPGFLNAVLAMAAQILPRSLVVRVSDRIARQLAGL